MSNPPDKADRASAAGELDAIYIAIGDGGEITEAIMARIDILEAVVNPPPPPLSTPAPTTGCGCGDPAHCWECAAIRGGCPEDV